MDYFRMKVPIQPNMFLTLTFKEYYQINNKKGGMDIYFIFYNLKM